MKVVVPHCRRRATVPTRTREAYVYNNDYYYACDLSCML